MRGNVDLIYQGIRTLFLLTLLLTGGLAPAWAQDGDPNPQFLIERIVVEGIERASARDIVAAETRLREGQPYTEPALREAIYRVKRLPFVLDAEFSLRKGTERGAYELVITVEPTRPVFFFAQADGTYVPSDERFGLDAWQTRGYASVGARQFLGAKGLLFASVDKSEYLAPSYRLGYTHYNPFGAGSYATVGGSWNRDDRGSLEQQHSNLTVEVGIPIAANQSLRGTVAWDQSDYDSEFNHPFASSEQDADAWAGYLEWIHDTRDDPLFPSRGDRLSASVGYSSAEVRNLYRAELFEGEIATFEERYRYDDLSTRIDAARYFRLTGRQSASLGGQIYYHSSEVSRPSFDRSDWNATVTAGHSVSLWGYEKTERIGDLRFESQLSVGYNRSHGLGFSDSRTGARLATGLVFRNAWGVLWATFSYTEDEL
jgi:outer membrane protein assembly factor BamA